MKNKKIVFIIIISIAILFLGITKSEASLKLNELNFDAQINEDGSMNVTETWDINISRTNTLFKTFKRDKTKYSEITDVTVKEITLGTNKEFSKINTEMYHVTKDCYYGLINSKGMFEIAWGVGLDNSSDTRKYEISYKVTDAIAQYNDYSELYWQFIGDDFEISAKKINGTILLPGNAEAKEDIRIWGHTEDLNGEIYVTDLNKIEFAINDYSSGRYVEVRSLIPNNMIETTNRQYNYNILEKVVNEETEWANQANARRESKEKTQKTIIMIVIIIGTILTIFFIIKIFKNIKKLKKLDKKLKPTTELEYFRELPYEEATPAEALFVMSTGTDKSFSSSFSANILDLCLRKYITLETIEKNGKIKSDIVKINLLDKEIDNLKADEKLTLDFLKEVAGQNTELTTKDITKYLEKHTSKVEKLDTALGKILKSEEQSNGNYDNENEKIYNKYLSTSIIYFVFTICSIIAFPLAIVLGINGIVTAMMAHRINVLTQKGVDEKEQWKAFKKYMQDFSLLKDKEIPALVLWEKYLVFATAFGISEKVLKQLKVVYPEIIDMNSAMYTYSYIHIMNSVNIGNCINTSVYSAIASSGSGAGGGFSGGGGGGRWPEVAAVDANSSK